MEKTIKLSKKWLKILIKPSNLIILVILFISLFFANKFRENGYASVPLPGENADEYSFGWLGISLIRDHYPIAWSGISAYKNHDFEKINVDGIYNLDPHRAPFSIDKPWFDHPPLMGLLVGGYAYLHGVRDFIDASVIVLRRPMLKIASINIILVFILATQLFGKKTGVISSILYSIIPTVVISSRMALAENAIIPLFLISLILTYQYFKTRKKYLWILSSIFASVSILFKLSGISVNLALILMAMAFGSKDRWKLAIIPFVGATLSLGAFALYGAYFGWPTFVNVLVANASRFYGASSQAFYSVITNPKIVNTKTYTDGWITTGVISFLICIFVGWKKDFNIKFLSIAFFSYLIIFLIFGSESYGNYRFPFYPFIIISTAYIFSKLWEEPNIILSFILSLLPLGTSIHRILGVVGFQNIVPYFRIGVIVTLFVMAIGLVIEDKKFLVVKRSYLLLLAVLLFYWTIRELSFVNINTWYFVN